MESWKQIPLLKNKLKNKGFSLAQTSDSAFKVVQETEFGTKARWDETASGHKKDPEKSTGNAASRRVLSVFQYYSKFPPLFHNLSEVSRRRLNPMSVD